MDLQAVSTQIIEQENLRTQSENNRLNAELDRIESENHRIASECDRISAENLRITVEADRINSENLRAAAEEQRIDNENTRIAAETQRETGEIVRETTETKRIASEQNRDRSEILRASAETIRQEAETARQAAERQRATAEAERQETMTEIDTIMQGVVTAGPTDITLRDIEPNIVTDALRKTPQHLTPDEQAQVKANLAIMELTTAPGGDIALSPDGQLSLSDMAKRRLFIDLWNQACGKYGRYNPTTGHFELNGLTDITYQQAIAIYNLGTPFSCTNNFTYNSVGYNSAVRTTLPTVEKSNWIRVTNSCFHGSHNMEVLILSGSAIMGYMHMYNLKRLECKDIRDTVCTANMPRLEEFRYVNPNTVTRCDKSFAQSSLLSYLSVKDLIQNELDGTVSETITVHPDVYTKLTDENNIGWHQLMLDAAAKNIQFATV